MVADFFNLALLLLPFFRRFDLLCLEPASDSLLDVSLDVLDDDDVELSLLLLLLLLLDELDEDVDELSDELDDLKLLNEILYNFAIFIFIGTFQH